MPEDVNPEVKEHAPSGRVHPLVRLRYTDKDGGTFASRWESDENCEVFQNARKHASKMGLAVTVEREPNAEVSHRDRERQPAADQPSEQP